VTFDPKGQSGIDTKTYYEGPDGAVLSRDRESERLGTVTGESVQLNGGPVCILNRWTVDGEICHFWTRKREEAGTAAESFKLGLERGSLLAAVASSSSAGVA
jgi:hypothetical protein